MTGVDQRSVAAAVVGRSDQRPDPTSPVLCNGPFVSMEFDAFGNVQACCANALYPLGNVRRSSLREIWSGSRARKLRAAIVAGDLSYGCMVCRYRWMFDDGEVPRDYYDELPVTDLDPLWPQLVCLSLHNTCNLECIMCGADASSRIRSRRTDLAPLPHAYDDQFFEELLPFLEHAALVDLVGGEPFLVREHRRVWDLLRTLDHQPRLSLTTNGTIWNEHVESVLADFDVHICVSIDGLTPETFERVRVGSSCDDVLANIERFRENARLRGTSVNLSFSLVRQNWFELGAVLAFAEERGMMVSVQTVLERDFGVQHLPDHLLATVVEGLERESVDLAPRLEINREVWDRQVHRLRSVLDERRSGSHRPVLMEPPGPDNRALVEASLVALAQQPAADEPEQLVSHARELLATWSDADRLGSIELAADGSIAAVDLDGLVSHDGGLDHLIGSPFSALLHAIEEAQGALLWVCDEEEVDGQLHHTLWYGSEHRDKLGLIHRLIATPHGNGATVVVAADLGHLDRGRRAERPPPTPVAITPTGR